MSNNKDKNDKYVNLGFRICFIFFYAPFVVGICTLIKHADLLDFRDIVNFCFYFSGIILPFLFHFINRKFNSKSN